MIIISHDRGLLNRAVGGILHLEEKKLTYWNGPYDQFARQRAEQRAVLTSMAKKQQARKEHLQKFVDRFKAKASKAKQAQARVKMIEKMDTITPPEEAAKRVFTFPQPDELSPPIIHIEGGSHRLWRDQGAAAGSTCASTRTTASRCWARTVRANRRCRSCFRTACR